MNELGGVRMRPVEPYEKCDRCQHEMRRHAQPIGMICMVGRSSREAQRNIQPCLCDAFVAPAPAEKS